MTDWNNQELDRIGAAEELEITTRRGDGSLRAWVPIWSVRVGDGLYVRSYRGTEGAWYRHAASHGTARVRAAGVERDVTVEPAGEDTPAIDDAYRGKYARYAGSHLPPMLSDRAVATTARLRPHD
jgi:hypothetical protein